ncbi:E3 ubiquitin-protein ligase tom1, partial [Coemansia sp. RSA 486]
REDAERKEREEAAKAAEEERLRQADAAMALDNAEGGNDDPGSGSGSGSGSDSNNDDSKSDSSSQSGSDGDAAAAQNPEQAPEQGQAPQQESTPEPVFVTINGERMDISDTGIDPEFLDALPDELRMEVIQGRREELRLEQQAAGAGNQTGSTGADAANAGDAGAQGISQEFLDALPPDIREELLEEERLQRQILAHQEMIRQRFGGQSSADAAAGGATRTSASTENVSPVTAAVQDRLSLIVPSGSASSRLFQLRRPSHHAAAAAGASTSAAAAAAAASGSGSGNNEDQHRLRDKRRKKIASRDIAVQLLSRSEMAALARFMFLPNHAVSSSLIAKTMQYLCENGRTRSQLIHLMLSILDSNATSLSDVETIIRQTILHGNGSSAVDPPALGASESSTSATAASGALLLGAPAVAQFTSTLVQQQNTDFSFQLSDLQSDVAAYVPAQRSLDMLHNLAVHNTRASVHFLVEHQQLKSLHSGKQPQQGSEDEENHFP